MVDFLLNARQAVSMTRSNPVDTQVRSTTQDLQIKIERQNLIIQTLLTVLMEKKIFDEDEFREWMNYVDGLDGRVDGKLAESQAPKACPKCKRINKPTAPRCQYCDYPLASDFLARPEDQRG